MSSTYFADPADVAAAEPAAKRSRRRQDIADRFKWNLTDIFATWEEWEAGYKRLEAGIDTYAALILPHLADPFGVLFMAHYYQTMSAELEEAARTDGLTGRAIFWRILLPLSGPGLAVVGVNGFLTTWNAFLHPLVLTTSESMRTLPVGLALFAQSEFAVDWGALLAGSSVATLPVVVAFAFFQRQIVEGVLQGSGR